MTVRNSKRLKKPTVQVWEYQDPNPAHKTKKCSNTMWDATKLGFMIDWIGENI